MTVSIMGRCDSVECRQVLPMPLYLERVSAGFPSPAQDFIEKTLDLNELCIQHPAATFFVRVEGESMRDAGIYPGDVLVVDRSLHAVHGDIVIASLQGEMTVKELCTRPRLALRAHNAAYPTIAIANPDEFEVFGVVTNVVRPMHRGR
ncbi:MAG: translesion error-prone polymerase autoproteolytic subunit [Pseudomonadota bacterium]